MALQTGTAIWSVLRPTRNGSGVYLLRVLLCFLTSSPTWMPSVLYQELSRASVAEPPTLYINSIPILEALSSFELIGGLGKHTLG